jgi:hypothetical protein
VREVAPNRMAKLRVAGIDISVAKEELRQALASAAGCGSAEVQVGETRTTRYGIGTAWIRCPEAAARKLVRDGKVPLGWSTARVTAIPKRPLQCFKCLELGHVCATCTSNVDRGDLCYSCGSSGHRARGCPASAPKCPLCESLEAPANQDVRGSMRTAESQEEVTDPRTDRGGNARGEHRRTTSGGWPGGGHEGDRVNSNVSSNATWADRKGRKTCSPRPSGRARSPSRQWPSYITSPTLPTGSGMWTDRRP